MKHAFSYGAVVVALVLAGCGGGGGGSTPLPTVTASPVPTATPTPVAPSTSAPITAVTGGTLSVTSGSSTLNLTIPWGALSQDATVKIGFYNPGTAPKSAARRSDSVPSSATVLNQFWIDLGGAHLLKPLKISLSGASAPASGFAVRLAKYSGTAQSYFDVDTAEFANGALANDNAAGYVGISSGAGPSDAYEFYSAPSAAMTSPSQIQLKLAAASAGPYAQNGTAQFTVSGMDGHGFTYAFMPAFALDSSAIGTVVPAPGDQYSAVVTFGTSMTPAHLLVSDSISGAKASISVAVSSEHPVTNGTTYAYAGTLVQTTTHLMPTVGPTLPPMPDYNVNMNVSQNVTVADNQSYNGTSNLYDIATAETRSTQLQTTHSTTHAYYGFGDTGSNTNFLLYGTDYADDNNNTVTYQYSTPQVIDRLPETSGDTWSNTAASNYYENDSVDSNGSAFQSRGNVNADGSYTQTIDYPAGYIISSAVEAALTENKDGSGSYTAPFFGAAFDSIQYSAPTHNSPTTYIYKAAFYQNPYPTSSDVPSYTATIPVWFSPGKPFSNETDVNNGQTAIPQACNVPASLGTNANQLVRTIDRVDTILGSHETQTTTTYAIAGVGTVCMQMHDILLEYYDFVGDVAYINDIFNPLPYQTTTTDETLGLQQNGTAVLPNSQRRTAGFAATPHIFVTPSNASFLRLVNHARVQRSREFIQAVRLQKGSIH